MTTRSTQATGLNVTTRTSISIAMAVLVAALAACGGGGGSDATGTGPLSTGSSVNAQATRQSASPIGLVAEPAAVVNATTAGSQGLLAAGATGDGGHAVAWLSQGDGAANATVRVQRFDADGAALGSEIRIAVDAQSQPAAAVLADGGVAIAHVVTGAASANEPWITRTSVVVRRFDAAGSPVGAAVEVAAVNQDRIGAQNMRYVAAPSVARWDDGGFVVGWAVMEENSTGKTPQVWGQRFDGNGLAVGAAQSGGNGDANTSYQLTAAPAGGWLLTTFHRTMGRTFLRYHAFDGAVAPVLPAEAIGVAQDSILLPLYGGGLVLIMPAHVYGSFQLYGSDGQPNGNSGAMNSLPAAATALRDGGFVTFTASGGQLLAQRYDRNGRASGEAVATAAGSAPVQGGALFDGGVAVGWSTGAEPDVMTQRLR
ncbi:MAG: hypothetical protein AVDCRST_MAG51-1928 [uncultured Ramlibacter sp.]|uniref:Uncharacterized protein n=1 Tax=uncultured Ramlibacter sp. TaxID=260755 RepID=A0A6J4PU26_9BURK|nr:MAG: hypothetical protein AVDCRST_MAG51-1928 [uncultured Ramlibacter sp.]